MGNIGETICSQCTTIDSDSARTAPPTVANWNYAKKQVDNIDLPEQISLESNIVTTGKFDN